MCIRDSVITNLTPLPLLVFWYGSILPVPLLVGTEVELLVPRIVDATRHLRTAFTTEHQVAEQIELLGEIVLSLMRVDLFSASLNFIPYRFINDGRTRTGDGFFALLIGPSVVTDVMVVL